MNISKNNTDLKLLLNQFDHLMQPKIYSKYMEAEVETE
jgi:hypothetical protein